jgi:hypothetical protein
LPRSTAVELSVAGEEQYENYKDVEREKYLEAELLN